MSTPRTRASSPPLALSMAELAGELGVTRKTLYAMLSRGELRTVKIGRCRRVPWHEVERLLGVPASTPGGDPNASEVVS